MENAIRHFRANKGLTQEQLGQLVGVQKSAVSKWEVGVAPSASSAIRIEEATNGAVPRWVLRPDLWQRPEQGAAA